MPLRRPSAPFRPPVAAGTFNVERSFGLRYSSSCLVRSFCSKKLAQQFAPVTQGCFLMVLSMLASAHVLGIVTRVKLRGSARKTAFYCAFGRPIYGVDFALITRGSDLRVWHDVQIYNTLIPTISGGEPHYYERKTPDYEGGPFFYINFITNPVVHFCISWFPFSIKKGFLPCRLRRKSSACSTAFFQHGKCGWTRPPSNFLTILPAKRMR